MIPKEDAGEREQIATRVIDIKSKEIDRLRELLKRYEDVAV